MSDEGEAAAEPEPPAAPEFPGFSEWRYTRCCCTKNAVRMHNGVKFLGHWEVSLGFPIFVLFVILSSYLVAMFLIYPYHGRVGCVEGVVLSILCFLFTYSYVRTIIDGPGYFPFYYPMRHDGSDLSSEDSSSLLHSDDISPSGIATTTAQLDWIAERPREQLPRCIFSQSARRFVVRPDHICGWVASWIGKRNHKFFWLFNFWGALYITLFTVGDVMMVVKEMVDDNPTIWLTVYLTYAFFGTVFGLMTWSFAVSHLIGIVSNVTSWEQWNHIDSDRYDKGCKRNVEDVCGSCDQWYCFLCPVSPWEQMSNEQFLQDYVAYYDPGDPRSKKLDRKFRNKV